jgi:superfamily II DNA/RNA helicase
MKQSQRERVMKAFRDGKFHVLVATDVAARGIDVKGIDAVINHDVPKDMEYYVHRIGRTGRNQTEGSSYTLIASDVNFSLSKIEKITNEKLLEIVPSEYDFIEERSKPKGGFGGGNRRGGFGGGQRRGNNNFGRSSNFGGHGARDGRSGGFNHHGHNGGGKFSHSGRNNNNGNSGR